MRCTALVLFALCGVASADDSKVAAKEPPPDPIADEESAEANLESNAPRSGYVLAFAIGPGFLFGGDIGVGRGGALSIRLGHVATRRTVITFEATGSGALHKKAMMDDAVTDSTIGLYAGALRYTSKSTWVRLSGGLAVFTANAVSDEQKSYPGFGALLGGGFDLVRWGYLVLGIEVFGMASVTRDGFKVNLGSCLGLSYY